MSKIKNARLDQYNAELFKQQQFGTAGVKAVNLPQSPILLPPVTAKQQERSVSGRDR